MCVRRQYIVVDGVSDWASTTAPVTRQEGLAVSLPAFGYLDALAADRNRVESTTISEMFDQLAAERQGRNGSPKAS
jgi:hypothetical protein